MKQFEDNAAWNTLAVAVRHILNEPAIAGSIDKDHIKETPTRVVAAWKEMMGGCREDPVEVLSSGRFPVLGYTQMVYISGVKVYSLCAHHLLPFIGEASFGYIPRHELVGLSKIPRLIQIFSKRPQVQEKLTDEIVDCFNSVVNPEGCGLVIRAAHLCMACRGVKEQDSLTTTRALRGTFANTDSVRSEFLMSAFKER